MIELYSGTPGSGKSYHVTHDIWDGLRYKKKHFICNFEINVDKVTKKNGNLYHYISTYDMSPKKFKEFSIEKLERNKESQCTLVIDECGRIFNPRDWNANDRRDWLDFFAEHRKWGYDIILVTQSDRQIDRQIRSMIEYEIVHRKMNNYGLAGLLVGMFCMGSMFCCVRRWKGINEKVGSTFLRYNKRIASMYDTFKIFDKVSSSGDGGKGDPSTVDESLSN